MNELAPYKMLASQEAAALLLASRMHELTESDMMELRKINMLHRFVGRSRVLLQKGALVTRLRVLCKGWAIRSLQLDAERRQILDFVLPGDIVGLHRDAAHISTCDVTALTPCEVGEIELRDVEEAARVRPGIAFGLGHHLMQELARANEQVVRLGRMTAYERVCSFLLNLYERQELSGANSGTVDFPITQTVVSDALGLSVVHVNRQVMQLRREGLVTLNRRELTVHDAKTLAQACGRMDWSIGATAAVSRGAYGTAAE